MKRKYLVALGVLIILLGAYYYVSQSDTEQTNMIDELFANPDLVDTNAPVRDKPYSEALERKIQQELSGEKIANQRPDYLPAAMFSLLPMFPEDFYAVRTLIRVGRITDLENLEDRYWMQPEFYPKFEEIGVPLLQNPPEGRWGAYGLASYPAESIGTINAGDTLRFHFFMRSNYLVETYQGINFEVMYPKVASISTGIDLPNGEQSVTQDPSIEQYFDVEISPKTFILEPNFPVFRKDGTKKITVSVTARTNTPPGTYAVALDTVAVPPELDQEWNKQYLTRYAGAGMTKLDRPYYTAFITVGGAN